MNSTETNLSVAQTILEQLGGRRFVAMTGASQFMGDVDHIAFKLPPNKSKANKIKITLTPMDTYTIRAYRINMRAKSADDICKELQAVEDVYADNLQEVFTSMTGLYTRL